MRRALRLLLTMTILFSTLLCAVTVGLWVRSWTKWDVVITRSAHLWLFRSHHGMLHLHCIDNLENELKAPVGFLCSEPDPIPFVYVPPRERPINSELDLFEWRKMGVVVRSGVAESYYDSHTGWIVLQWEWRPIQGTEARPLRLKQQSVTEVTLPHLHLATLTGLTAAPGLLWLFAHLRRRWRSSRRLAGGLCTGCGYDLRASPHRCPECGRAADGELSPLNSSADGASHS